MACSAEDKGGHDTYGSWAGGALSSSSSIRMPPPPLSLGEPDLLYQSVLKFAPRSVLEGYAPFHLGFTLSTPYSKVVLGNPLFSILVF